MRRAVFLLLLLGACGTPQERCIARETRDLRVLDRLIAETEGNLKRGYALEDVVIYHSVWVQCPGRHPVEGEPAPPPQLCLEEISEVETRPKAINLADEAEKLASMQDKRRALVAAAAPAVAQCRATFPE